eukprot:7350620-Prymnesium_polylepis.1
MFCGMQAVSFALSLGKDWNGTIKNPQLLADTLQDLVEIMPHVVIMDRDLTLTPIASKLLELIAPKRDVHHVQLTPPGQRNAFCYTFNHREHTKAGRGMPLALKSLMLHVNLCKKSFEDHTDDQSEKGPSDWRRLLIAVGTKKLGEEVVLPLLNRMGVEYIFYHGNSSEELKRQLRNTTQW